MDNSESLKTLIKNMEKSRGKKIFFVLVDNYIHLYEELIKAGFVEGQDFINAAMFLSEAHGVFINTYNLVRNM